MLEVLANYVFFPNGIYALISLIIIIVLYFLKKKTTISKLPTIMFLLKEQGKKKYKWFPRIPFNLLLLLYLLIATLLALAIMEPFYQTNASNTQEHVIHLIDNSASMQTASRFENALEEAKQNLGSQNTIVVTSPKPTIVLEKGSYLQARTILTHIELTDATTPLAQSVDLVQSQQYEKSAIHIYSDFLDDSLTTSELEIRLGSLQNFVVVPHLFTEGENIVGFVDATVKKNEITLLIRNFREYSQVVTIAQGETVVETEIPANDIAPVTLSLPTEPTQIKLSPADDVMADNIYYLSAQSNLDKSLLYVTDKPHPFTTSMLDVLDFITYDTYIPPGVVDAGKYDSYIFENVDPTLLLPSNVNEALENVYSGGVMIIKMGNKMRRFEARQQFPYTEILPKETATISFTNEKITESLTAASEEEVFPITISDDTVVLMQTQDGKAVIAYKPYGQGGILYYGINDEIIRSQFKQTYAYPILFQRLFKLNFNIPSLSEQQKKTGEQWIGTGYASFEKEQLELPLTLSKSGFYTYQGSTYGINMLSLSESQTKFTDDLDPITQSSSDAKIRASLLFPIILAIISLIALELFYLKKRGDY